MVKLDIAKLAVTYCKAMAQNLLCIINNRLVYLEPVTVFVIVFVVLLFLFPLDA